MYRKYLLFIILAVAAVLPGCGKSKNELKIDANQQNVEADLKALVSVNIRFRMMDAGMSDDFIFRYHGYCKQTSDIINSVFKTPDGLEKFYCSDNVAKICVDAKKTGRVHCYYFRYKVTESSKQSDGLENITGFMIVAWPEEVGQSGTKIYITNEYGTIYYRDATQGDQGEDPPYTGWPDVDADDSEWKAVS